MLLFRPAVSPLMPIDYDSDSTGRKARFWDLGESLSFKPGLGYLYDSEYDLSIRRMIRSTMWLVTVSLSQ